MTVTAIGLQIASVTIEIGHGALGGRERDAIRNRLVRQHHAVDDLPGRRDAQLVEAAHQRGDAHGVGHDDAPHNGFARFERAKHADDRDAITGGHPFVARLRRRPLHAADDVHE